MSEADKGDVEERIKKLEDKIDVLQKQAEGDDKIRIEAYDLKVEASSEETAMEDLMEMCSDEMENLTRRALIGEYQELEEEDLFMKIFGGE